MKVLQATTARGWSGGTEQALLLAKYMCEMGHEAHVLAVPGTELEEKAKKAGLKVVHFPNTKRLSLKETRELARIISDYDAVNTHIPKAHWFVWLATLLLGKKRPKLIYTRRVHYKLSPLSKATKYRINTDGIIAVAPNVYNYLKSSFLLKGPIEYIPSGVELDRFNPSIESTIRKEVGIPDDALLFVNVANYSQVKGQHVLLPAFRKFLDKTGVKAYLLLVGRDTQSKEAQKLIRSLGLEKRVIGLGYRRDVPQILKGSDVFVFPSLHEGIAGSVIQAMAMKKIVVSTPAGGIGSYLKDGVNGIEVKIGSVESMVEGMERALKELHNEKMKEEARKTAEEFDIRKIAQRTLRFYERCSKG